MSEFENEKNNIDGVTPPIESTGEIPQQNTAQPPLEQSYVAPETQPHTAPAEDSGFTATDAPSENLQHDFFAEDISDLNDTPTYNADYQNGGYSAPPENDGAQGFSDGSPYRPAPHSYERINYSDVAAEYRDQPVSAGLKVFSIVLALIILLTGVGITGYFLGISSVSSSSSGKKVSLDLTAKPKDTDEMTAAQVFDEVNKSIVGIQVYNTAGVGAGASGVFYSADGYIITNDHIYSEVPSPKFKIYTSDGNVYDAKYVAGDTVSDLAVLKIDDTGFEPAVFGDSNEIVAGENVVAVGRPSDATKNSTITKGIVSLPSRRMQTTSNYSARLIQTDSAINPGSSGGALVNMYGQVVGITSSKISGEEYDAVGFAIPTTTVKRIVSELISDGKVTTRAKLGITYNFVDAITDEISSQYSATGLYVAEVSTDSELYGKVKQGDTITAVNGQEITDDDIVLDLIEDSVAGDSITVTVVSASGGESEYTVALKANVGESSYSAADPSTSSSNSSGNSSGDGTFNFPYGE